MKFEDAAKAVKPAKIQRHGRGRITKSRRKRNTRPARVRDALRILARRRHLSDRCQCPRQIDQTMAVNRIDARLTEVRC